MIGKKTLRNTIAVILTVIIGLMVPVQAASVTLPKEEKTFSSFSGIQGSTDSIGNIITEISDKRTETTKEFMLDDGTTMIAEYNQPVHYKNDKGKWVEYNNSLITDTSASTADEVSNGNYTNKNSDIDIKLSNKAKSNNMVKLSSDNYSISWGYDNANKSKINIVKNEDKLVGNEKFTDLKNITSEAKYEEVYKNVDLQYFVTSTGIKENIIMKNSDVQNEFNITYKIKNLTAKQTDDYSITLYNKENKAVYTISAPYMTDAKGESSNQIKLELVSQKGGNLKVRLTADYWFIHSIGRSFPITVDPEITNKLTKDLSFAEGVGDIYHSYGPYYASNDSYLIAKLNSLPELNDGEKIVSAKFNFETTNGSTLFTNENDSPIIINAHKLTALNGGGKYDSTVLDYDSLTYNDNQYLSFDLTKTVNEWYENGDEIDGFILEAFDTVGSKKITFKEASKTSVTPSVTIVYKDFTGTESNLTYHTVNVGHNAQASVSDYLGNLVIRQNLYEGTGSRMPVTLTATYNSINYNKIFENGSPSGYGWQFSFNQYVRDAGTTLSKAGYNYIYTDSDGTDHYLKKSDDSDEWYDEDGLGITLTKDANNLFIDNGTTTQTYELTSAGGKLLSEKDEHNNAITYTYTDGNVTKITDGSGRVFNITYYTNSNGSKRVKNIKLPDRTQITFNYTSTDEDKISYIELPDKIVSLFTYNDSGIIKTVQQAYNVAPFSYGTKLDFTYNNKHQVTKLLEYGSDGSEGNYLDINYGNDNTTVFSDRRGRNATYTFDNSGNQVSVLNANGYLESGDTSGMSISTGADSFTKNYITESTEQSAIGSGKYFMLINGGTSEVVSTGGICAIDKSEPSVENGNVQYLGSTSLKVSNPVSSTDSAFFTGVAHQFNDTSFNGKDVTFSAYAKTKNIKQIYGSGAIGAILKIKCFDSSGKSLEEVNSVGLDGTQDWQRLSVTATVPANTSYFRVYCMVRYASGTAWFDCLQLEEGSCANDFNALQNGNFETNEYWLTNENKSISAQDGTVVLNGEAGAYDNETTAQETTVDNNNSSSQEQLPTMSYVTNYKVPDSYLFKYDEYGNVIDEFHGTVDKTIQKIYLVETEETTPTESATEAKPVPPLPDDNTASNNILSNSYIYQNVKVGRAGVVFNLLGEAQAKSVPLTNENRTFGIALNIYYKDNEIPETHYHEFNADTVHRQSICMAVSPNDMETVIDHVAFAFVYGYNKNVMTIYNAMLNFSPLSFEESTEDDNSSTDNNTTTNSLEYDGYIYCETLGESKNTTEQYMQNSKTYDTTGNYVISETNQAGGTVEYTYDVNGNVTSTTDGEENVVNYTYDSSGNISQVSSYDAQNKYYYNGAGNISAIDHNNFRYLFNYDVWGNLISTKIGNVEIAKNTYNSHNGMLEKTTYANGDYLEYLYDVYDNIIRISGENGVLSMFVYNKKGLVSKVIDVQNGTTTYYYYDFNGKIEKKYCQTENGELSNYVTTNADGEIVEKILVNGHEKTIVRGNDNGLSYVINDGIEVEKTKDEFERVTQVKTSRGTGKSVFFTDYEYASGNTANSTVNLVNKVTHRYGNGPLIIFNYTYDSNGNIVRVGINGAKSYIENTYDELNQLVSVTDKNSNLYTSYSYDNAGNITNVSEYKLNGSTPTTLIQEKTYTYSDSNWKDKLTSYNGTEITYDAVGNPLSYRDGMTMKWRNGRQLATLQTKDNCVNYKYDSNGIRIQKSYGNNIVNYYYDSNNNLCGMSNGNNTLFFYYDDKGKPTSFSHNGTMYYYLKNVQGDIIRIVNQSGTAVANYVYDAWGNILSVKDGANKDVESTDTSHIANLNPYRYRGYIYDNETGLYYLNSRYYDPVTGRFINADIYCDTMSSIFGTNMFAYCNNNPVNQVDPEGTDAKWLQFSDAVDGLGHTSLLIQDVFNNWWYFYWGNKQALLRPCGKDDFTMAELNSYLSGFDPRPHHNYYVFATNVFDDSQDANGIFGSMYYTKSHDGVIDGIIDIDGKFELSHYYAVSLLVDLYNNSNATNNCTTIYENGKKVSFYHIYARYDEDVNKIVPDAISPVGYYYMDIKGNGRCKSYDLISYNCVQASMDILLKGEFDHSSKKYRDIIDKNLSDCRPNEVYKKLKSVN